MPLSPVEPEELTVLSKQKRVVLDPPAQLVVDAKALYDLLKTEQQGQDDERAALEVSLIKEDLEFMRCLPSWVPHDKNPADALAKAEGAHAVPLMRLLSSSSWTIREESAELEERKEIKSTLGYVPRPRHSKDPHAKD